MSEPVEPTVRSEVRSLGEGDAFLGAQELADAYRDLVYCPSEWPEGAAGPRFFMNIPSPSPAPRARHYWIVAEMPGGTSSPFVRGASRGGTQEAGIEGWEEIAELAAWRGLGRSDGATAQVVLQRESQHVHLVSFPSLDDVVRAALSLESFAPRLP